MLLLQVQCIGNETEAETLNVRSFLYIWDHATFFVGWPDSPSEFTQDKSEWEACDGNE